MPPKKIKESRSVVHVTNILPDFLVSAEKTLLRNDITNAQFEEELQKLCLYVGSICFNSSNLEAKKPIMWTAEEGKAARYVPYATVVVYYFMCFCTKLQLNQPTKLDNNLMSILSMVASILNHEHKTPLYVLTYAQIVGFYCFVIQSGYVDLHDQHLMLNQLLDENMHEIIINGFPEQQIMLNKYGGADLVKFEMYNNMALTVGLICRNLVEFDRKFSPNPFVSTLIDQCARAEVVLDNQLNYILIELLSLSKELNTQYMTKCFFAITKNLKNPSKISPRSNIVKLTQTSEDTFDSIAFERVGNALDQWMLIAQVDNLSLRETQLREIYLIYGLAMKYQVDLKTETFKSYLHFFAHHTSMLPDSFDINGTAQILLKKNDSFPKQLQTKDKFIFDLIFLLLARKKSVVDLTKVRALYHEICEKYRTIHGEKIPYLHNIHGYLFNLIINARDFSVDDFVYFYEILESNMQSSQCEKLIFHLLNQCHKTEHNIELSQFCQEKQLVIERDARFFNIFLRKTCELSLSFSHPEYTAFNDLNALIESLRNEWNEENNPTSKKMVFALKSYIDLLTSSVSDESLPSEKISQLQEIRIALAKFQKLREYARENTIKINRFYIEFTEALEASNIDMLASIQERCANEIAQVEKTLAEDKAKMNVTTTISIEEAKSMLKADHLGEIEKLNHHFVVDPLNMESYLIKIKCLIQLGYIDDALIWLTKTKTTFPIQGDIALLIHWAKCCRALGQYTEALETGKLINLLMAQKTGVISTQSQLFLVRDHLAISKEVNLIQALNLCNQLLMNATEAERPKIICAKARCLIQQGHYNEANILIQTIPDFEKNADALACLGKLSASQEDYINAREWYQKSLAQSVSKKITNNPPGNASRDKITQSRLIHEELFNRVNMTKAALYVQIHILQRRKKFAEALVLLKKIESNWGKDQRTYIDTIHCHRSLHQLTEAFELIFSYPAYKNNKLIVNALAMTYSDSNQPKEAFETFDYLIFEFPSFTQGYFNAIKSCIKFKDYKRMDIYWQRFQDMCPEQTVLFEKIRQLINAVKQEEFQTVSSIVEKIECMEEQEKETDMQILVQKAQRPPDKKHYSQERFFQPMNHNDCSTTPTTSDELVQTVLTTSDPTHALQGNRI